MSSEISRKILALSEEVGALRYGDFTLASGAKSSYYFDGRLISLHPEGAYLLGKAFLQSLAGFGRGCGWRPGYGGHPHRHRRRAGEPA